jgi:hypothetical protein
MIIEIIPPDHGLGSARDRRCRYDPRSMRTPAHLVLPLLGALAALGLACSSAPSVHADAGVDREAGTASDAGCGGPIVTTPGETCTGFGTSATSCDPACGQPYGYVCIGGGPPASSGCRRVSESAFGETYCCPKNDCVAQPDQDGLCGGSGQPRRYQCPPDGDGGSVAPPADCVDGGSGASEVEKFYCCP